MTTTTNSFTTSDVAAYTPNRIDQETLTANPTPTPSMIAIMHTSKR